MSKHYKIKLEDISNYQIRTKYLIVRIEKLEFIKIKIFYIRYFCDIFLFCFT